MCGIVGGVGQRDIAPVLLEGLKRLEYRGYDSAGMAIIDQNSVIDRHRVLGKVVGLEEALEKEPLLGSLGIAHTRWATHGEPSTANAHPHICGGKVAVVHNGIIENHEILRQKQLELKHKFISQTDTEVIVHEVYDHMESGKNLLDAVRATIPVLEGAYALGVVSNEEPDHLVTARLGSPLVIGVGIGEYFIASDVFALLPVTQRFIFLEDGDIADIRKDSLVIYDASGNEVDRPISTSELSADASDKAGYRHYMLKEIFTQPRAIADTLEGRIINDKLAKDVFGLNGDAILDQVKAVQIVACGTSYHAGLVAKYWLESLACVPCQIEVASEFRYREHVVNPDTLFLTISQSGETADTLAALKEAKKSGFDHSMVICNVPESSLTRESDLVLLTRAGTEIGVASTKAFTTQLVALMLLVIALGRRNGMTRAQEEELISQLESLPGKVNVALELNDKIESLSKRFSQKHHALYLGRGTMYPIAMEGALKIKEISYIHAEAYPAGELKHGPLALVDEDMPIIAVAPNNSLIEKLKSNLEEVRARGGELIVFADVNANMSDSEGVTVLNVASVEDAIAPIIYTIPLQLFSYHVAVIKGADVDQPRNLAKSVTVE